MSGSHARHRDRKGARLLEETFWGVDQNESTPDPFVVALREFLRFRPRHVRSFAQYLAADGQAPIPDWFTRWIREYYDAHPIS